MKRLFLNTIFTVWISFLVALLFMLFLLFIGIPKTQSRNYYLLARDRYSYGDRDQYVYLLQKAVQQFPELYIIDELHSINN